MQQDRIRWNKKHRNKETHSVGPSKIVEQFFPLAPRGRALDIAAGTGRNALFLANQGFVVDAVDISDVALRKFSRQHPNLSPICADLDTFDIPRQRYSLILNIRFLKRRLFPYVKEGLIPGGMLIFETYVERPGENGCRPSCRDYLLRDNELLHAFLSLKILFYQETDTWQQGRCRCVASLVAMKEDSAQK